MGDFLWGIFFWGFFMGEFCEFDSTVYHQEHLFGMPEKPYLRVVATSVEPRLILLLWKWE
jgi:hypothetical protein